jgi:hypothetical protein
MSEQNYKTIEKSKRLIDSEDEESRVLLKNSKRYQSEYHNLVNIENRMPSINESFENGGDTLQAENDFDRFIPSRELDNRTSKTSQLEDEQDSMYSSSPRVKFEETKEDNHDQNNSPSDTPESSHESFLIHPDASKNLPEGKSSSLISSSKTSVGFLKELYFQLVELIKYRSIDKLRQELLNNDDVYGPIDMTNKILLHYACEFNSIEICKIIVECLFESNTERAQLSLREWVNITNNDGLSAIHFAAYRGNNELISYLISIGADVNAIDRDGHN